MLNNNHNTTRMKKYFSKKTFLFLFSILCFLPNYAYDFEINGIRYDITSFTELTVKASSISETLVGDLSIPSEIEFSGKVLKVTEISDDFANSNSSISSLTINEGIVSIGNRAFINCANLKTIDIAQSVTLIGEECFYGCSVLESFRSNGIVTMGASSFAECKNLKEVSIESLDSLQQGTFLNCSQLMDCNLPNINSIGKEAFKNCQSLKEYNIPASVTTIGESAFENLPITSITIPNNVLYIDNFAFKGCTNLLQIIIPNNVRGLGVGVFEGCIALTSVSVGSGIKYLPWIFEGCINLSEMRIEDSITTLCIGYAGEYKPYVPNGNDGTYKPYSSMFNGLHLNNVYIGRNITTEEYCYRTYYEIEYGTRYYYNEFYVPNPPFSGSNIESVIIGPLVSDLKMCGLRYGEYVGAFENCINLDSVVIQSTTTEIPQNTFSGCSKIEFIEIPNTVTKIGSNAFYGCAGLKKLTLGSNLVSIEYNAFEGCDSLTEINIKNPNPPTYNEFTNKHYINTKVNIPSGCLKKYQETTSWQNFWNISEQNDLFFEVDYIKYSVISNNKVEIIGNDIFEPTDLYIKNYIEYDGNKYDVVSISNAAFKDCSYLLSVQIDNGISYIGDNAFNSCTNLNMVTIPQSVTIIGKYAFQGCKGLKNGVFEDGEKPLLILPEKETYELGRGEKYINRKKIVFKIYYYESSFSNLLIEKLYIGRNLSKESRFDISEKRCYHNSITDVYYGYNIYSYDAPFGNLSTLKELTIGENVNILGPEQEYISEVDLYVTPGSFKKCSSIQCVNVKSQTPPSGAEFSTTVYNNAKLYVPDNTYNLYSCADGWKDFVNLIIVPNSIVLDKDIITMNVGDVCKISATVYPENTTDKTITWVSSDDSVVKVSDSGEVTGVSKGKATITASCGNVSASCEVEVTATNGIEDILTNPNEELHVYNLQGVLVADGIKLKNLKQLPRGCYIVVSQSKKWKIKI